jgi:hypothetical protein
MLAVFENLNKIIRYIDNTLYKIENKYKTTNNQKKQKITNKSVNAYYQVIEGVIWNIDIYENIRSFLDPISIHNLCIAHKRYLHIKKPVVYINMKINPIYARWYYNQISPHIYVPFNNEYYKLKKTIYNNNILIEYNDKINIIYNIYKKISLPLIGHHESGELLVINPSYYIHEHDYTIIRGIEWVL